MGAREGENESSLSFFPNAAHKSYAYGSSDLGSTVCPRQIRLGRKRREVWTYGESDPDLVHAMDAFYR